MKRVKKSRHSGNKLHEVQRANQRAKFYRNELEDALLEGVEMDHKRKIAKAESGYFGSLLGYLMDYALRSRSIEELNEWKEKFKTFNETQWKRYKQEEEDLRLVDVKIFGRRIVKNISC